MLAAPEVEVPGGVQGAEVLEEVQEVAAAQEVLAVVLLVLEAAAAEVFLPPEPIEIRAEEVLVQAAAEIQAPL